jgi:hypothetical protein
LPLPLPVSVLSSGQGSAVPIAVVCFFVCHPVRDLLLLLPLPVPAVILSEAKDPEELNEPKPSILFNPYSPAPLPLPVSLPNLKKSCHFDRSCSRICEQRSGEIRFSTQTLTQPKTPLSATPYSLLPAVIPFNKTSIT